jgi:hypothetical protein
MFAVAARPRDAALGTEYGDRNPVIVGNGGYYKLEPITERAGAKDFGIHAPRLASGRQ